MHRSGVLAGEADAQHRTEREQGPGQKLRAPGGCQRAQGAAAKRGSRTATGAAGCEMSVGPYAERIQVADDLRIVGALTCPSQQGNVTAVEPRQLTQLVEVQGIGLQMLAASDEGAEALEGGPLGTGSTAPQGRAVLDRAAHRLPGPQGERR